MSSVQYLREFIKERLTAVCEEIFSEVQKTIVQYEEEINRQHRLLDISRKPDRNSHIIDLPQQHDCEEEEGLDEQQVCNQERNSNLDQEDPEPPQIKEEQEEHCSSQEGEQLGLKQEAEGIIVWTDEEQLRLMETIRKPVINLHRIDVLCQHAIEEEEALTEQQVFNQERNSSLDQEDPEPPQIIEEQEKLCRSQEGDQLGLKQETVTFMVTPAYEESYHSKPEPNSELLLSHSSPEAESRYEKNGHVDSGSTRNTELKKRRHRKRVDNSPVSVSQSGTDTKNKSVQCDVCGKTLQNKYKMTEHLRVHTGEKPYTCSTCGKRFAASSTLKTHTRIHTGEKPYYCSTCGKGFADLSGFKKHTRIHAGEKPYSCSICGKRFIQKSNLECHVRIHTGEKPYPCTTCGKTFADPSAFKAHMRIHTGEKPYSCNTCGKRFIQKSNLECHVRIHTGEKPYPCSICGERFVQRRQLKKHMRIHMGSNVHTKIMWDSCESSLNT